jgi:hypothetical protein
MARHDPGLGMSPHHAAHGMMGGYAKNPIKWGSRSNCQKMYGKGCSRHTLTVYFSLLAGHKALLVIYYTALCLSMRATSSLPRGISVPKLC